jgi:hypothetical protein
MEKLGFQLVDSEENTYSNGTVDIGISHDGDLKHFCDIDSENLITIESPVHFRVLSAAQYLRVYNASARDGYRRDIRQKKDNDKIALINKFLTVH